MSSIIEVISSGDSFYELSLGDSSPTYDISSSSDVIYEVTLDQPDSIYEVTISDTSPTYEVISFEAGMLSLALIDDGTPTAFRAYSSFKVSELLTGYATTSHNHDLIYQPLGTYLTPSAIGTTVQAYDADLTSWAGILPSSKQDTLTFDLVPTDASINPVQSNGVFDALALKQDSLVSGTNIKSINGTSLLGAGDITISSGGSINYGLLNNSINQLGGSF